MSLFTTLMWALLAITVLGALFGLLLGFASVRFKVQGDPIAEKIDAILPQTQCGQCGYPGCKPYAQAVANGEAINKCAPGGQETIEKLAQLLGVEVPSANAHEKAPADVKMVAFIDEANCIGCTKCIQACPVDAISGSARQLHTVVEALCTGCELCVAPCPTDCIVMRAVTTNRFQRLQAIPVRQINAETAADAPATSAATPSTDISQPTAPRKQP
ncbi:MAG: electron transport complex subunit RsxB [Vibrionaceae bacterium]